MRRSDSEIDSEESSSVTTRRDTLKTIGVATTGAVGLVGLPSIVSGSSTMDKERFDELIAKGNSILESDGPQARDQFLRNKGLDVGRETYDYALPDEKSDVSTNSIDCVDPTNCNGDIRCSLSITMRNMYDPYSYVELSTSIRYNYRTEYYGPVYNGPERPKDAFGIAWERDHWQLRGYDPGNTNPATRMAEGSYVDWDNGSWNQEGTGFRLDDRNLCTSSGYTGYGEEWSDWTSGGVDLELGPDWSSGDTVTAIYKHSWNANDVNFGVSISYPFGISITPSGSPPIKSEDLQTNKSGTNLAVTQGDS